MATFGEALKQARAILETSADLVARGVADTEAEQLLAEAYRRECGARLSRLELFSRMGESYPAGAEARLVSWARARAEGKLLQHLTGVQAFLDHEYDVGPEVLVPRPETEFLVVTAIEELSRGGRDAAAGAIGGSSLGLEVGLGSGAISIELMARFAGLRMIATELTDRAAARALGNARKILGSGATGADRLKVIQPEHPLEVLEPFARERVSGVDFLISNPPYLTQEDGIERDVVAFEPWTALFAPKDDALHFYRRIAQGARPLLKPGGRVFLEIAAERAEASRALFDSAEWIDVRVLEDLTGKPRVLVAKKA